MKRIFSLLSFLFLLIGLLSKAHGSGGVHPVPSWIKQIFNEKGLTRNFEFSSRISPNYFEGDFSGRKKSDVAVWIKQKKSGKYGIALINQGSNHVFILGAGKESDVLMNTQGIMTDDFDWVAEWSTGTWKNHKMNAIFISGEENEAYIEWSGSQYEAISLLPAGE